MNQRIPKNIHYCWLSSDPFPAAIQKSMKSWKEKLPEYDFVLWDFEKFDVSESIWVRQAFEAKKYAFAADYIRLYALYHHGGIYLDTDVEVVKNFDDLLELPYFAGTEGGGWIEAGILASEKNADWVKQCLDYFDKPFLKPDNSLDMITLPQIMNRIIQQKQTIEIASKEKIMLNSQRDLGLVYYLFEKDFFCGKNMGTGVVTKTANTYTIHHFAMSWITLGHRFLPDIKRKLIKIFGEKLILGAIKIFKK